MRISLTTYCSRALLGTAALIATVALAACGGDAESPRVHGNTLTVYASLPRHGASAAAAEAVSAGERLALADAHGRVGKRRVRLIELDDSDPAGETWDPATIELNAKRAAADPTTIAYIGELDLGGSAVSVPVTNDAQLLQISPGDGLTSLTEPEGGAVTPGPERYYPRDTRTFVRLVPTDALQASSLIQWAAQSGARTIAIVGDGTLFGREIAAEAAAAAARLHITVTDAFAAKDDPASYPGLAAGLAQHNPDAVLYTGVGTPASGQLLAAISSALPGAALYGTSSLATAEPAPPGLPPVEVVKPALPAAAYPVAGRRVLARLRRELGAPVAAEALYGYEAMRLVLDSIRVAGRDGNVRADVAASPFRRVHPGSLIGSYVVSADGDVSLRSFAGYRRDGERLTFEGRRAPDPGAP